VADPERNFMHHSMSHHIRSESFFDGAPRTGTSPDASSYQLLLANKACCDQTEKFSRTGAGPCKGLWAKPT
jgi:hypothetical protein